MVVGLKRSCWGTSALERASWNLSVREKHWVWYGFLWAGKGLNWRWVFGLSGLENSFHIEITVHDLPQKDVSWISWAVIGHLLVKWPGEFRNYPKMTLMCGVQGCVQRKGRNVSPKCDSSVNTKIWLSDFPGVYGESRSNCIPVIRDSCFFTAQDTDTMRAARQSVRRIAQGFCVNWSGVFICIEACVSPCLGWCCSVPCQNIHIYSNYLFWIWLLKIRCTLLALLWF